MSRVTVLDDVNFDYDIYMNHILNHKKYRFFQASFDPDAIIESCPFAAFKDPPEIGASK